MLYGASRKMLFLAALGHFRGGGRDGAQALPDAESD